jgi:hypothetical protein
LPSAIGMVEAALDAKAVDVSRAARRPGLLVRIAASLPPAR